MPAAKPIERQRPMPDGAGRCLVMGVLNVTPDSFSDGGRFNTIQAAVDPVAPAVEAGVRAIAPSIEACIGTVTLSVEVRVYPIALAIESLGERVLSRIAGALRLGVET